MLTCIGCSRQISRTAYLQESEKAKEEYADDAAQKPLVKTLAAQIKGMAVKASGAYKSCKPCTGSSDHKGHPSYSDSEDAYSEKIHCSYRRTGGTADSTPKMWGKEMEAKLKGMSSGERTPVSSRSESMIFTGEDEPKEWVAHAEPGVLITFVSLPQGGNELKKIRFRSKFVTVILGCNYKMNFGEPPCRDMFNKWQAQQWWTENYEKVIELYNVRRFNQQTVPLPTPQKFEDEESNVQSVRRAPRTPQLSNERLMYNMIQSKVAEEFSSCSPDHNTRQSHQHYEPNELVSTPKVSKIRGARAGRSSVDVSARSSSSYETDRSGQLSVSSASDLEIEWVEQDEPGVYITIRELPSGIRELRRVWFSQEKFGEMHARLWWEENRARIQEQYL